MRRDVGNNSNEKNVRVYFASKAVQKKCRVFSTFAFCKSIFFAGRKMKEFFKSLVFSKFMRGLKPAKAVAVAAMLMAASVVFNIIEIKLIPNSDVQFSLTITISAIIGYVSGPLAGLVICMVGDLFGFFINSGGGMYMIWVGLSTGFFAFFAGLLSIKKNPDSNFAYLKILLYCVITFAVCTVGINSLGFYLYNMNVGFSPAVKNYIASSFGGDTVPFFGYVAYRLFFKLQILNSVLNYVLIFILFVDLKEIRALKFLFK